MELEIREFEGITLELDKRDLNYLKRILEQTKLITLHPIGGQKYRIQFGSIVGFISLGNTKIRVLPKIPYISLFYLITRTSMKLRYTSQTVMLDQVEDEGLPIFHHFLSLLKEFIPRFIRRKYIPQTVREMNVRGRINKIQTFRENFSGSINLILEIDEFSENHPLNQIIKFAIRRSIAIVRPIDPQLSKEFGRIYHRLSRVVKREFTPQEIEKSIMELKRQNSHYKTILTLCLLIISGHSIGEQKGNVVYSTFILNMNTLYEKFVFRVVADYLREFSIRTNASFEVTAMQPENKLIVYRPDILIPHKKQNLKKRG